MLLPEPIVSAPDTTWLFWLEDCDWLMLCSAKFPPCPPCANALFPLFFWCWKLRLLHEMKVVPPDTHPAFWFDDCD